MQLVCGQSRDLPWLTKWPDSSGPQQPNVEARCWKAEREGAKIAEESLG